MRYSVQYMIATSLLLSSSWGGVCALQAQQSVSVTAERNLKFQPQLVSKTVNVINPPARGSVTTTLKGTKLAPDATGQVSLIMGDVEVTVEAQATGLGAPSSLGSQFEVYLVWALTPAGRKSTVNFKKM